MDNQNLMKKITEARNLGLKEMHYQENGSEITIILPEPTPRTTEMMY